MFVCNRRGAAIKRVNSMPRGLRPTAIFLFLLISIAVHSVSVRAQGAAPDASPIDIATAPAVLVMIGDPGCPYCARFMRDVAPGYIASDDGKLAPLVRRDRHDADIAFIPRVIYSPTFVMLVRGREIGRIVGYGGADLFWMQVAGLLTDARAALGQSGKAPGAAVQHAERKL
jgi:hypothetical protein